MTLVTARLTLPLLVEGPITVPSRQSCLDSQIGQNFMLCFCIFPQAGSTGCYFFYYGKNRNDKKYPFANVTFFLPFDFETLWSGKFNQNCCPIYVVTFTLTSSPLNIICRQILYQSISDYMDRACILRSDKSVSYVNKLAIP